MMPDQLAKCSAAELSDNQTHGKSKNSQQNGTTKLVAREKTSWLSSSKNIHDCVIMTHQKEEKTLAGDTQQPNNLG